MPKKLSRRNKAKDDYTMWSWTEGSVLYNINSNTSPNDIFQALCSEVGRYFENKDMVNEGILNLPISDGSCNIYHIDLEQFDGIISDMSGCWNIL